MPRRRPSSASETPSERLRADRPALRKSLGQHHLRSGASCRPLVEFLRPAGRLVVEVGPGGGVLTRELLDAGAQVVAIELDADWAAELRERIDSPKLEISVADALEVDWAGFPKGTLVAGNLPYNVGTPIVERVLRSRPPIERAGFLLQREVVDRMVAAADDDAYGALSVLVQLRADARRLGVEKPGAFVPPPKVDSAFIGLTLRDLPAGLAGEHAARFEAWIKEAFSQRRKTLANALASRSRREQVVAALATMNRPATIRAEALPLFELLQLFSVLDGEGREPAPSPANVSISAAGGTISSQRTPEET
jgi:16S rRNA (adenine1518-N6/adenine1519-N6)-dimethyltransferase